MSTYSANRVSRAAVAALAALSICCGAVTPAVAGVNDTIGYIPREVPQSYSDSTPALAWGIRDSWDLYTSGPTHVLDGAKHIKEPGKQSTFLWPYLSTETAQDGTVTVNYGGTVNYMKYCKESEPKRGTCDADVTLADPQIVFKPETGKGELYATVNYITYRDKTWHGVEKIKFADLDFAAGRYNNNTEAKTTSWRSVGAQLAPAGHAFFSNFYESNGYLNSLSFTYPGKTDLGADATADRWFTLANQAVTEVPVDQPRVIYQLSDGNIIVLGNDYGTAHLEYVSKNLSSQEQFDSFNITRSTASTFDKETDTLFWVSETTDSNDVKTFTVNRAHVSAQGLEDKKELASVTGQAQINGFVFNEHIHKIAMMTPTPYAKNTTRVDTFYEIDPNTGVMTTTVLPTTNDLYPDLVENEYTSHDAFGPRWSDDAPQLRVLADGSYIYMYDFNVLLPTGQAGALPVHITPNKDVKAKTIEAFRPATLEKSSGYRGVATDGTHIGIYNNYVNDSLAFMDYNPADQSFNLTYSEHDGLKSGLVAAIASMAFDAEGYAVIATAGNYLVRHDRHHRKEVAVASLTGNMKGTNSGYSQGIVIDPNQVYVLDIREEQEAAGIARLTLPGADGQLDRSVGSYTMAGITLANSDDIKPLELSVNEDSVPASIVAGDSATITFNHSAEPGAKFRLVEEVKGVSVDRDSGDVTINTTAAQGNTTLEFKVVAVANRGVSKEFPFSITISKKDTSSSTTTATTATTAPQKSGSTDNKDSLTGMLTVISVIAALLGGAMWFMMSGMLQTMMVGFTK